MVYIFVEGLDDENFVNAVIPDIDKIIRYKSMPEEKVLSYIQTFVGMNKEIIYFVDLDNHDKNGVIKTVKKKFNIDESTIVVVIKEIECWYLAGLKESDRIKLKIKKAPFDTSPLDKEKINSLSKKKHSELLIDLLSVFDKTTALKRNESFKEFYNTHLLR